MTDQEDRDDLMQLLEREAAESGIQAETEKPKQDRRIDPSWIKTTNWSRKRKRSKKLWKTTRGRGSTGGPVSVEEAMAAIEEVENG
jgi:hypothetical protein